MGKQTKVGAESNKEANRTRDEEPGAMEEKTNVMRMIEQKKLPYKSHYYGDTDAISGEDVAKVLGQDPGGVFKTLVCVGKSGSHYVFVIPVSKELDLKKAAKAVAEKSVEMVPARELLSLTGYVHGGCSPIGMKKFFKTTVDRSAAERDSICFSAGKIGYQVEMAVGDLGKIIRIQLADIT
ncbi:MAG: Cys-tRNA(Pro) deacylase [Anaerovoracaceae bacterium]|jgi:Cys-tRNA(Pro)/Cys-tRNA(Cys) deacylase